MGLVVGKVEEDDGARGAAGANERGPGLREARGCTQLLSQRQPSYLLDTVELVLHALDGGVLSIFHTLRLEDLRKCTLTLPRYQTVLLHAETMPPGT
jgi:hypothetical protein|eukprot:COSAG01_NODE_4958_length_4589_cov_21.366370_1_plen_97_part_00